MPCLYIPYYVVSPLRRFDQGMQFPSFPHFSGVKTRFAKAATCVTSGGILNDERRAVHKCHLALEGRARGSTDTLVFSSQIVSVVRASGSVLGFQGVQARVGFRDGMVMSNSVPSWEE